ncbi:MAG: alanine racemase [Bryobacterales bacterium]
MPTATGPFLSPKRSSGAGCRAFGVASMDEGAVLREGGIAGEIFVLSGVLPSESCAAAELGLNADALLAKPTQPGEMPPWPSDARSLPPASKPA